MAQVGAEVAAVVVAAVAADSAVRGRGRISDMPLLPGRQERDAP